MSERIKCRKIMSIAIISLFILSMFSIAVPLALAQSQSIALSPTSGPPGTTVTITGSGFTIGTYMVYFDIDYDSRYDSNEPYSIVSAGTTGKFTTTLTVPSVPSGIYYIRVDVSPYTPPAIASKQFDVTVIDLTPILDAIADIEAKLDNIVIPKLGNILTYLTDTIKPILDGIEAKLDDWFGTGGTYSKTTQFTAGTYSTTIPTDTDPVDLGKSSKVTLTVSVTDTTDYYFVIVVYIWDGTTWQGLAFDISSYWYPLPYAGTVQFTTGTDGRFYFEVYCADFAGFIYSAESAP